MPLLHAALRPTGGSPAARRAALAAAIFRPITAGTVIPGAVVVVAALVDVGGNVVVVVVEVPVLLLAGVFLAAGELPHEEMAQAASTPTAPLATSRPHGFMCPSLPLDPPGRPLPAGLVTSRC